MTRRPMRRSGSQDDWRKDILNTSDDGVWTPPRMPRDGYTGLWGHDNRTPKRWLRIGVLLVIVAAAGLLIVALT